METYDAFISYSHARDRRIAAALQSVLQKFGHAEGKRRLRVFRDDTGLAAAPALWAPIEQALVQSRFFVLLGSTDAAESEWVNKEVAYWREHKGAGSLLIGVTSGDLQWHRNAGDFVWDAYTPLPPALKSAFAAEPKWVDLRPYRWAMLRHFPLWRNEKFIAVAANFGATIGGLPKESLVAQELRQQRRERRRRRYAVAALVVFAGFGFWQWREAGRLRNYLEPPFNLPAPFGGPSASPGPAAAARGKPVYLSLTADLTLWIDDRMIDRQRLISELDAATHGDRDRPIYLRADKKISYDEVSQLLGTLRSGGYPRVSLVMQSSDEK